VVDVQRTGRGPGARQEIEAPPVGGELLEADIADHVRRFVGGATAQHQRVAAAVDPDRAQLIDLAARTHGVVISGAGRPGDARKKDGLAVRRQHRVLVAPGARQLPRLTALLDATLPSLMAMVGAARAGRGPAAAVAMIDTRASMTAHASDVVMS